jgi:hypothetical protein
MVLGEVLEVLDVECGEREVVRKAASCDPHVVLGARATSSLGGG